VPAGFRSVAGLAVALGVSVLLLAGCGGGSRAKRSEGSHQVAHAAPLGVEPPVLKSPLPRKRACSRGNWAPSSAHSYAVIARDAAVVRSAPGGAARVLGRFGPIDQNGYRTVFAVVGARLGGCRPAWYRVQVPMPPNGSTGWVSASAVRRYVVRSRIVVELSRRQVSVYRSGLLAFRAPVAVGASSTPTPTGRFYVNERFVLSSPNGPFGVAALGISAHSNVLHDWVQGGPIALHGTNDPASIGSAASHGCLRLHNQDMRRLFALAPAGTPVLIRP
jgi:lipoprotein-anchoring transpeptidase ErfK/SrfK